MARRSPSSPGSCATSFPGSSRGALKDIAELDYAFAETLALVLGFYVIMFMLIEIPLIGYIVAPTDGAADQLQRLAARECLEARRRCARDRGPLPRRQRHVNIFV